MTDTDATSLVRFSDRPGVRVVAVTALVFVPTAVVKLLPPFDQAVMRAQVAPRGGHARMPGNCVCVSSVIKRGSI